MYANKHTSQHVQHEDKQRTNRSTSTCHKDSILIVPCVFCHLSSLLFLFCLGVIDLCCQGPEWDVEVSEHAQRPRQRAAGPPQAASGEMGHTNKTNRLPFDANVPTYLTFLPLSPGSPRPITQPCLGSWWVLPVSFKPHSFFFFQPTHFFKIVRVHSTSCDWHPNWTLLYVYRESARRWKGPGLHEEVQPGSRWGREAQSPAGDAHQPDLLLQTGWDLCGESILNTFPI